MVDPSLHSLYTQLQTHTSSQNHPQILDLCDKILTQNAQATQASQCRLIAFIKTRQYDQALKLA